LKVLLERGLDEQHRDNAGWGPLHYAAFEGLNVDIMCCRTRILNIPLVKGSGSDMLLGPVWFYFIELLNLQPNKDDLGEYENMTSAPTNLTYREDIIEFTNAMQ
jgi:hypothetical protein